LDLGCGHGVFGAELSKRGCQVTFADEEKGLLPEISEAPFIRINLDKDNIADLGQFDLVICSNVLEHLAKPDEFLASVHKIMRPQGKLYLSWTNWLSPWGGHEFSPFHYFGTHRGYKIYDKMGKPKRIHTPFKNLYPTYIGKILKKLRSNPNLRIVQAAPRYYPEFAFILRLPVVREFLTWNCALLIERRKMV
jgi:2-polyprenyl-3-methyl-5-hydroxy-6-metoxy-1,4-benzoquinol methylase